MTATLDASPEVLDNEFPTLDLDGEDMGPAKPAVHVRMVEHAALPVVMARALPSVVHARRRFAWGDEHEFIDTDTGAAVRYRLTMDPVCGAIRGTVAETGPRGLWDRIVVVAGCWERAGRPSDGTLS